MKRLESTTAALRQAHRTADPMTGVLLEFSPNFDPNLLPHVDWPVSPSVERAINSVMSEAIEAKLSFRDAYARVRAALESYGIELPDGDEAANDLINASS